MRYFDDDDDGGGDSGGGCDPSESGLMGLFLLSVMVSE
jgi:hypothetical protein